VANEYGPLAYDQTHVVKVNATTFLPGNQSLGTTIQWASGTPFSLIATNASADYFGSVTQNRVSYPTGQRNDQRNEGYWLLNLSYRKNFVFGKVNASVGVEVENLLNEDYLTLFVVDQTQFQGVTYTPAFGRRWQLSAQFNF
jgi:outer membrane receptor protein involved in Fe transport